MSWDLPEPPPNIILWATALLVLARLLVLLLGLRQRRIDRARSIVDDFWYRTIILPLCWRPLFDLISKYVQKVHECDPNNDIADTSKTLQLLIASFATEKNLIESRFILLTSFKDEIYQEIRDALDQLEDELALYCAENTTVDDSTIEALANVEYLLWHGLKRVCEAMMVLHPKGQIPIRE